MNSLKGAFMENSPIYPDVDAQETQEWLQALQDLIDNESPERARYILQMMLNEGYHRGVRIPFNVNTPYCNTLQAKDDPEYPGDEALERKIDALIRWNAVAMVLRAGKKAPELGGHIASFASSAILYAVAFNHFFKAANDTQLGDLAYIQGHVSPGIYARSFLEGRFSESQLDHFRQEVETDGLSSYPHPWLMPDYWQFPTVSMGLGPLQGIYQARFLKYLSNRELLPEADRKVWVYCGDGEMDEPESLGAISLAGRENLDNLIFVINCNLQRLDGPVRGNSKIIQELEGVFRGAGWNVIKTIWGRSWDRLFEKDTSGKLIERMEECVDGDYQIYKARDGAYVREHFFGKYPELVELVADMSDDEIWQLTRGGHDPVKVYAAYKKAVQANGRPTLILAKTVKGFGMGAAGEGLNTTHQQKKMSPDDLKHFRDRFDIPITDAQIPDAPFYRPAEDSPEVTYLKQCREKLGGKYPARRKEASTPLKVPGLEALAAQLKSTGEREISTTMAFVRILNTLLKDKNIGQRIVPIVPDECRTFGMEGMFRQLGIYSPHGQCYQPVDSDQIMYYREDVKGQILEEGINEAGAFCSWLAAATSYSSNDLPMIPFYIYYSMFGFQRVGDLAWAAGDMQARGFLLGGTAGRTTLAGEGLQHQDGHSLILSGTIPNCVSYDPTYAYEMAVIVHHGLERMYARQENVYFYITAMNENYTHPDMPEGVEAGIIKGMYCLQAAQTPAKKHVQLLGSGTILREVLKAGTWLFEQHGITSDVWSVTSVNELRRDALHVMRDNRLHPDKTPVQPYVTACLADKKGPVIAATDYMRLYVDQIREFIPQHFVVLGTDGFGRSDTRKKLRHFFEVDSKAICFAALSALTEQGEFEKADLIKVMKTLGINPEKPDPVTV